jgi:hypothetical protein
MALIEFVGYAPDVRSDTPGIFVNCANVVPTLRGFAGSPSPQTTLLPALAATCQGGAVLRNLDDTTRLFAGTATKLYEAASSSWSDVSRAVGGAYALGADVRWRFAQFGSTALAVAKSDTLQFSSTGAFADVTGAPKAAIVETVNQFVMLLDTTEATFGDSANRWYCSALGDYTDWTPDVTTQCASGLLLASQGKITAGKRFGEAIVVYKQRSLYIGIYVGPPAIWDFRHIPGEAGALSQEAVIDIGTSEDPRHIFMGEFDFYSFDGARPVPIGAPWLKETVFGELNRSFQHLAAGLHDRVNSRVYFYYPGSASATLNKCVVYNYKNARWGRDDREVEVPVDNISSSITYGDLGTYYATYGSFPDISYGSGFWTAQTPIPSIFNTSHVVQTLTGGTVTSSITMGDYGDDSTFTDFSGARLRYLTAPTSAEMVNYYRDNLGDTLTPDQTTPQTNSRFDVLRSARWHRMRFDFVGNWESTGFVPAVRRDGDE